MDATVEFVPARSRVVVYDIILNGQKAGNLRSWRKGWKVIIGESRVLTVCGSDKGRPPKERPLRAAKELARRELGAVHAGR